MIRSFIFILVLVALAILVARFARGSSAPPTSRALEILQNRFARGEITAEEYRAMRREIEK